jgi:hypothetical protein
MNENKKRFTLKCEMNYPIQKRAHKITKCPNISNLSFSGKSHFLTNKNRQSGQKILYLQIFTLFDSFWSDPLKLHKSEHSDQSVLRGVGG